MSAAVDSPLAAYTELHSVGLAQAVFELEIIGAALPAQTLLHRDGPLTYRAVAVGRIRR